MQNNTFSGLIVGQNIVVLPRIDSTNNFLKEELSKSKPLTEGTVIMAEHQFAGRGQINNKWDAEPGKNLTFSILLAPTFLSPDNQFLLNKAVSIGINDVLTTIIGERAKIKWPNDIYAGDLKVGGILIENIIRGNEWKYAIVGIGINVNQLNFDPKLKNAGSLKSITDKDFDIKMLLKEVCTAIENRYWQLKSGNWETLDKQYIQRLYRLNQESGFRIQGHETTGTIREVTEHGLLNIEIEGQSRTFGLKEIEFII